MNRLLIVLSLLIPAVSMAIENFPESHEHHHHEIVKSSSHQAERYACDLVSQTGQCREYEILDGAKTTLAEIKDGCESMKGLFTNSRCPEQNVLSVCSDIIRNYHQPDVIYSNYYFSGELTNWTIDSTRRVCSDLGGEFLAE